MAKINESVLNKFLKLGHCIRKIPCFQRGLHFAIRGNPGEPSRIHGYRVHGIGEQATVN